MNGRGRGHRWEAGRLGGQKKGSEKFTDPSRGNASDKVAESVGMSRPTLNRRRPRHLNILDTDHDYLERRGGGNASLGLHLICKTDRMWREKIHNLRLPFVIWADQFERTGDIEAAKLLRNLERQLGQWETEAEGADD